MTTRTNPSAPCTERDHTHEIGLLAYHLWETSGCPAGQDVDFWLEAEQQLLGRRSANGQSPPARCSPPKQRAVPARHSKQRPQRRARKAASSRAAS